VTIRLWPQFRANGSLKKLELQERLYWKWCFDHVFSGFINTWDYQWVFACWVKKGLGVIPAVNLVSNIGFGDDSTHTTQSDHPYAALRTESLGFPLIHPESVNVNPQIEELSRDSSYKLSALKYVWMTLKEMVGLK
jgi:hypothetical protein